MQTFQKPENALKRANELLSIGQEETALKILHSAIGHKRFRSQGWDSVQESIMLRHLRLCVKHQKLRLARDGLHQYRIISQHANIASLGKVIAALRQWAEEELREAKAEAGEDGGTSAMVEDLDLDAESPEALLLSTLQVEVRSASARLIHSALRSIWDVYKMILDLLRTTPKLERVYHDTARKAFTFCRENNRPQEFKRLCDVLRSHFQLILKNKNKEDNFKNREDYESLLRPDLHLETRMQQLVAASELELWKECQNSAEDIYALGLHEYFYRSLKSSTYEPFSRSREKLMKWLATYYEKMAKVMWVSDNYLFHALAWIKFLLHVKQFKKNASQSDLQQMSNIGVLAILTIGVYQADRRVDDLGVESACVSTLEQQKRLTTLLGHATLPTREGLKAVLHSKDILNMADDTCRQLYYQIESEFTPLKLCTLCLPLLEKIKEDPLLETYVVPLKRVIFHKLIFQLSRVYASISIDYFTKNICTEDFFPWTEAEKQLVFLVSLQHQTTSTPFAQQFLLTNQLLNLNISNSSSSSNLYSNMLVNNTSFGGGINPNNNSVNSNFNGVCICGANGGPTCTCNNLSSLYMLNIRIDYASSAIIFESNGACSSLSSAGNSLRSSLSSFSNSFQHELIVLARQIDRAVNLICPGQGQERRLERKMLLQELPRKINEETNRMIERNRITNQRRQEKQFEQQKIEEEKKRKELEQKKVEERQEKERKEEAQRKREERRLQQEKIKQRSETAKQMLDEIKKIGKTIYANSGGSKITIKGKQLQEINIDDVLQGNVDYDDLEKAQQMQIHKERVHRVRLRRAQFRRVCHMIRACREMEIPKLKKWKVEQLQKDTELLLQMQTKHELEHKSAFEAALEEKQVFQVMKPDKDKWVEQRFAERKKEFEGKNREQKRRLLKLLKSEKLERAKERRTEHLKKLEIEAVRKRKEEEEKRILQEMERKKVEEEARERKFQEVAEKQRKRDMEIEEKQRQQAHGARGGPRKESKNDYEDDDTWRKDSGKNEREKGDDSTQTSRNTNIYKARRERSQVSNSDDVNEDWRSPIEDRRRNRETRQIASMHNNETKGNIVAEDDEGFTTIPIRKASKK